MKVIATDMTVIYPTQEAHKPIVCDHKGQNNLSKTCDHSRPCSHDSWRSWSLSSWWWNMGTQEQISNCLNPLFGTRIFSSPSQNNLLWFVHMTHMWNKVHYHCKWLHKFTWIPTKCTPKKLQRIPFTTYPELPPLPPSPSEYLSWICWWHVSKTLVV